MKQENKEQSALPKMTTPKDIIDSAEKKYPNAGELEIPQKLRRDAYVVAKVEERAEMMEFIKWASREGWVYLIEYDIWENLNTDVRKVELNTYWIENLKSKTV